MQSLRKIKTKNPVFLLDEIDKMGQDFRGDPASALLEVLDPEQNNAFSDHYLEVNFDLSDVMFITTANTLYPIPPSLLDRMEVIKFPGYTSEEKTKIAQRYLVPKQSEKNGLQKGQLQILDRAFKDIIRNYTQEAGLRNLEREIANICRKVAKIIASKKIKKGIKSVKNKSIYKITPTDLREFLGIPKFYHDETAKNEVGVATGLAWTEYGGDTLNIEVSLMKGKGSLILTGKLGEVMRESAQAALSYVRENSKKFDLNSDFYKNKDIHIHVPEGAMPKDGPSAGITMACALVSALTGLPVKKDVAMTGEITLRGRVLSIGGFKEKVLAAHRVGIKAVIFPSENRIHLEEIPKDVQKDIKLISVKTIDEMLDIALEKFKKEKKSKKKEFGKIKRSYPSVSYSRTGGLEI